MTDYSHILFNKSPLQLRLLGARGGRAYGRKRRARRAPHPSEHPEPCRPFRRIDGRMRTGRKTR